MVERFGGDPDELTSFYVLADYRTRSRSDVQQERARRCSSPAQLGWPWKAAARCCASCRPRSCDRRLRRYRPKPVSRVRPLRAVPDSASGIPRPLRRVNREGAMKIVIPGGSGQVGTILARAFHRDGHDVVVLSRVPASRPWRVVAWDGATLGDWQTRDRRLRRRDQSGGPQRQLPVHRRESRGDPAVARAVDARRSDRRSRGAARPPRVWLQASTATIYAHRYDSPNDERSGILGGGEPSAPDTWRFSIDVARAWERAFDEAVTDAHAKGRAAVGDDAEPGPRRHVRHAARPRSPRPRRQRRRRPAVHVVDSLRGLHRGGSMADRAR